MKDSTTPKEQLLKKVRKALLEKRDNPYPNLEEQPLYPQTDEMLEVIFAEELTKVGGTFVYCESEISLIENILQLAEEKKWRKIYCWEPILQKLLKTYEYPFYETDKDFEHAEVGFTLCEALIARNGTVLLSNANAAGRRLSIYPSQHVVVAFASQLVLDLKDAFSLLKKKYGGHQALPTMLSFTTGPSCTTAIENTPVIGAQGPKELFVFLLDDLV
ncbi:MAG TPA: LUD domain-containing protein [Pelobium sp.]